MHIFSNVLPKRAKLRAKKGRKGGAGAVSAGGRTPVSGGPATGPAGAVGEGLIDISPLFIHLSNLILFFFFFFFEINTRLWLLRQRI
jgi:hypothetical protein